MDKIGLFICTGCDIDKPEKLDLDKVKELIEDDDNLKCKASVWKTHECLCGDEGLKLIKDSIEEDGLDSVAIAACSGRYKEPEFSVVDVPIERIPLREFVAWGFDQQEDEEIDDDLGSNITMLAADYIRFGLTRIGKTKPVEPFKAENMSSSILVVGGGVTGMNAALNVAKAGYEALLIEKEEQLGGLTGKLYKQFPTTMPFEGLQDNTVPELIKQVESAKGITLHKGTTIEKIAGGPGLFDVTFAKDGSSETSRVGAIVMAAGASPYKGSKLKHLGYGEAKDVITSFELEEMAANGGIKRPSDGKAPKSVAFIQCAGSRDENHLKYCSSHCCMTSLKQAHYVREMDKDAKAFIIYRDMRTPGLFEEFYRKAQNDEGVFLTKGDVTGVEQKNGKVLISADNTLLGDKIELEADLVVLATGLVPTTKSGNQLFDNTLVLPAPGASGDKGDDEEAAALDPSKMPATVLHLAYRQGPEVPNLEYGFPDSHFICFPYETRRTGIYAAGTVRQPMDTGKAAEDGIGAALKAIQCVEATINGRAVHPRAGDQSYPDFFMQRCTQCKRCTEECPFGAINEDEKGNPLPEPTRCRRCGTCMGACPERIISFKNFSVDMIGSTIKSMFVPDEFEEKPRIIALVCENDAMPALEMAAMKGAKFSPWVRFLPLRCMGSVNLVWVADALSRGIDGILMLGCRHGEDYQCHFVKGSELCSTRLSKVQETLDRLMLESDRIRFEQVQIADYHSLPDMINEFAEMIAELDPNPYKE